MLNWQAIDTVFLDMDGTLLDLHFDSHFWLEFLPVIYAEKNQLDPDEARIWLHERIMREVGTLQWYCFDYWSKELDLPITELKNEVADKIAYRDSVQEFLRLVRQTGRRIVIVTNSHRGGVDLKFKHTELESEIDRVISSHDLGAPKEEQLFWQKLQEIEPFDPARTLMVDDSLPVLRSARQYGIAHLLTIAQPDSQQPPRDLSGCEFPILNDFSEVFPDK